MIYPDAYYEYQKAKDHANYAQEEAKLKIDKEFQKIIKILQHKFKFEGTATLKDISYTECLYDIDQTGDIKNWSKYRSSFPAFFFKMPKKDILKYLDAEITINKLKDKYESRIYG